MPPSPGKGELCARAFHHFTSSPGLGHKSPDYSSATITPLLCKPGKAHGLQDEQGQVGDGGLAWGPGHKSLFPILSPGHLSEKRGDPCCSHGSLVLKPLPSTACKAHGLGILLGDSHIQSVSPAVEWGPPERLGEYLPLSAAYTSAENCKVSLVPL